MSKLGKIVADAVTERVRRYRLEHENWAEGVTGDATPPPLDDVLNDVRRMIEDGFEIRKEILGTKMALTRDRIFSILKDEPLHYIWDELDGLEKSLISPPPKQKKRGEPITAKAWEAYSEAFQERYKTAPLRNVTVNSQLASFVKRVGEDLAPEVIAFYVRHRGAFYSQKMHPVGLALADAEKLSAEYRSGRMLTRAAANREESIAANADLAAQIMREE